MDQVNTHDKSEKKKGGVVLLIALLMVSFLSARVSAQPGTSGPVQLVQPQDGAEVTLGELSGPQEALEEAKGEAIRRELQHTLPLEPSHG